MAKDGDGKYGHLQQLLHVGSEQYSYYDVTKCFPAYDELPFSKRILLESCVRNSKCHGVAGEDGFADTIGSWISEKHRDRKMAFLPSHVIWQDFTGLPAIIDLAAMRDAVCERGIDPEIVNLKCQVDVILDSSPPIDTSSNLMPVVQPSSGRDSFDQSQKKTILEASSEEVCPIHCLQIQSGRVNTLIRSQQLEFDRNKERFQFLKWSSTAFDNLRIVPPGSGVLHQFNLEYLANIVFNQNGCIYPDCTVGIDSHITMLNGLGVLAFAVSPMEAEAVMLGEPIEMAVPEVTGCRIINRPSLFITSTDIVLAITKRLRQAQLCGKVVEFFGPGVAQLSVLDRKTIANMCPEYGAIAGFFPVDEVTLTYLGHTGRDAKQIQLIKQYLTSVKLFRNSDDACPDPKYAEVLEVDLSVITSDCSGPKNPKDRVPVNKLKEDFLCCLDSQDSARGYGRANVLAEHLFQSGDGAKFALKHGDVVLASIASCTNSTNSSVMLAAGIMAKKAAEIGLSAKSYMKATVSPGTSIVTHYLNDSHLVQYMQQLGFTVGGYGCSSCISQNCAISESVVTSVQMSDIVAVGVTSGSRSLDTRSHPEVQANYLMSPLLVIAYALAGSIVIDFESDPIGTGKDGHPVYLRDIWPSCQEIIDFEQNLIVPKLYKEIDYKIKFGTNQWSKLEAANSSSLFRWSSSSTYISCPPFFDGFMAEDDICVKDITNAYVLLNLGHNISTDFISPAGSISRNTTAGKYLLSNSRLTPRELNSFGARRGCDAVMVRSTFGNLRLENKLVKAVGPKTIHFPSGDIMDVFDAAEQYRKVQAPILVLAGSNFGCGSAREWAAKGPYMLGVKAVIAESYCEVYRSSLVAVGILPLEYLPGQNAASLGVSGREQFSISFPCSKNISIHQRLRVQLSTGHRFEVMARLDTEREVAYFRHGGILQYVARAFLTKALAS